MLSTSYLPRYPDSITQGNIVHKLDITRVVFQDVISNVKLTVASFSLIARCVIEFITICTSPNFLNIFHDFFSQVQIKLYTGPLVLFSFFWRR